MISCCKVFVLCFAVRMCCGCGVNCIRLFLCEFVVRSFDSLDSFVPLETRSCSDAKDRIALTLAADTDAAALLSSYSANCIIYHHTRTIKHTRVCSSSSFAMWNSSDSSDRRSAAAAAAADPTASTVGVTYDTTGDGGYFGESVNPTNPPGSSPVAPAPFVVSSGELGGSRSFELVEREEVTHWGNDEQQQHITASGIQIQLAHMQKLQQQQVSGQHATQSLRHHLNNKGQLIYSTLRISRSFHLGTGKKILNTHMR